MNRNRPMRFLCLAAATFAGSACLLTSCRGKWFSVVLGTCPEPPTQDVRKGWQPAVEIGSGREVQVAMESGGEAIIVWTSPEGKILVARSTGNDWSPATPIDSGAGPAENPRIAINPRGGAMVLWSQDHRIHARRYSQDTWQATDVIDSESYAHRSQARTLAHASDPQIGFDSIGNALAVWRQVDNVIHYYDDFFLMDGLYDGLYTNRLSISSGWDAAHPLWTDDGYDGNASPLTHPRLAVDADGEAISLFRSKDPSSGILQSLHFHPASPLEWMTGVTFDPPVYEGDVDQSEIAFRYGQAVAVWIQDGLQPGQPPTDAQIYAQLLLGETWQPVHSRLTFRVHAKRYSNGLWENGVVLSTEAKHSSGPQVALDADQNALVAWREASSPDAEDGRIRAKWHAMRFGWVEGEVEISADTSGDARSVCLAFDEAGDAVVVWVQADRILSRRHDATKRTWGEPSLLSAEAAGSTERPRIAVDGGGNALVAWSSNGTISACWYR